MTIAVAAIATIIRPTVNRMGGSRISVCLGQASTQVHVFILKNGTSLVKRNDDKPILDTDPELTAASARFNPA